MAIQRPVTGSRLGRLNLMGQLVGGIAGGAVSEGARRLVRGERPSVGEMLLTPTNMQRLGRGLSELRGAAMKVGQLLSMDSGQLLPPQLSELLAQLREDAHQMPLGQVAQVLNQAWGEGWENRFERFFFTPLAAASIGQVHEARLRGGQRLAIKIQYPGIRRSIDSDVDNVASLLRLFKLLPEGLEFSPLLEDAKYQLHVEADYRQEAASLHRYAAKIEDDERFLAPDVVDDLTTTEVLTMTFLEGQPIESLTEMPRRQSDGAAEALFELALRELLEWGLVQTDPNFANFQYEAQTGRIQLLDFGATRVYAEDRRTAIRDLIKACLAGEDRDLERCASAVGYLGEGDPEDYRQRIIRLLHMVIEPATKQQPYQFGGTDLARRMSDFLVELRLRSPYNRLPPPDVLFLHRKLGGLYLLLSRLRARIPVREIMGRFL
jgi:predicted unusual protein kinase regulating ubiquinone biosynthesis (AarF/ABC1/UbiB family)